jgi:hypothetical protein
MASLPFGRGTAAGIRRARLPGGALSGVAALQMRSDLVRCGDSTGQPDWPLATT